MLNDLIAGLNSPMVPTATTEVKENPIVKVTQKPKNRSTEDRLLDIIETLLEINKMEETEEDNEYSGEEAPNPVFNSTMLNNLN